MCYHDFHVIHENTRKMNEIRVTCVKICVKCMRIRVKCVNMSVLRVFSRILRISMLSYADLHVFLRMFMASYADLYVFLRINGFPPCSCQGHPGPENLAIWAPGEPMRILRIAPLAQRNSLRLKPLSVNRDQNHRSPTYWVPPSSLQPPISSFKPSKKQVSNNYQK